MSGFDIVEPIAHGRIPAVVAGTPTDHTRLVGVASAYSMVANPTTAHAALPPP